MEAMRPLVKHRTTVLVLIANKYWYQWKMYVQRLLKTNLLHMQMENIWGGISIWGVPEFKPIWSIMGIIMAFLIRIRSYRYWMRLSRRSYGCATKLYMKPSYALNISGPGSWYSNVNIEHYQVWSIARFRISKGQYKYSTAVLSMVFINRNIDNISS